MAQNLLILGQSGRGKTTSVRTLDPEKTVIINVEGKSLPFPKWKQSYTDFKGTTGNHLVAHKAADILKAIDFIDKNRPEIEVIVIDDFQYVMTEVFMKKALEKSFDKFSEIGKDAWDLLQVYKKLRDNLTLVYTMHVEEAQDIEGNKTLKAKTLGKMIDQYITVEGLFTVVLYADIHKVKEGNTYKNEYIFWTQSNGLTTAKSPMGMFSDEKIPNDLERVIEAMKQYSF